MTAPAKSSASEPRVPARNLWPHGIVAAFVLFIAGTAGLIVLTAFHRPELVTADYYEQELRYQQTYDSRARAAALGAEAAVALDEAARRICVTLPPRHAALRPAGAIHLYRPAAASADRRVALAPDAEGRQELDARALAPGLWRIRVEWTVADQAYSLERQLVLPAGTR